MKRHEVCAHPIAYPLNVGTGKGMSVLEMVNSFQRITGPNIVILAS